MPLYLGSERISELYFGGNKIKELYHGSDLVYSAEPPLPQVIFESNVAGTYTVTIPRSGRYKVTCVGGGGGGAIKSLVSSGTFSTYYLGVASGGSGGYSEDIVQVEAGEYTVVVGNLGASRWNERTTSGSSIRGDTGGASMALGISADGGGYGSITYSSSDGIKKAYDGSGGEGLTEGGNSGTGSGVWSKSTSTRTANGGASVYETYGKGTSATGKTTSTANLDTHTFSGGTAGYVKIETA